MDELVLEGLRQADEVARLLPGLPQPADLVELAVHPSEIPPGLHPVTAEVVALLDAPRTFQELVDRCRATDLEAMRAVLALLERGYARRVGGRAAAGGGRAAPRRRTSCTRSAPASGAAARPAPHTVGKIVLAGGGPLARKAALARFQTVPGWHAGALAARRVRHRRPARRSATACGWT